MVGKWTGEKKAGGRGRGGGGCRRGTYVPSELIFVSILGSVFPSGAALGEKEGREGGTKITRDIAATFLSLPLSLLLAPRVIDTLFL